VERLLERRLASLDTASAQIDRQTATAEAQRDHDLERMATIFGGDFRVLPHLRPAHATSCVGRSPEAATRRVEIRSRRPTGLRAWRACARRWIG
jgi:hypothetical protein